MPRDDLELKPRTDRFVRAGFKPISGDDKILPLHGGIPEPLLLWLRDDGEGDLDLAALVARVAPRG